VTVDLLTTGVDVPKIENLVFLRRVNSRILYEQMLGCATRPCEEIKKETFRIFDAVDLYPHLQDLRLAWRNSSRSSHGCKKRRIVKPCAAKILEGADQNQKQSRMPGAFQDGCH
jgi:type I site-specific restriction endonuclease